jgi:hypothetical protein
MDNKLYFKLAAAPLHPSTGLVWLWQDGGRVTGIGPENPTFLSNWDASELAAQQAGEHGLHLAVFFSNSTTLFT